jgi:hypothetical protein
MRIVIPGISIEEPLATPPRIGLESRHGEGDRSMRGHVRAEKYENVVKGMDRGTSVVRGLLV